MDPLSLLAELVAVPAPPGQESLLAELLNGKVKKLGRRPRSDAKGNLIVELGSGEGAPVLVTAHLDEIAMIVSAVHLDGTLSVLPLGGLHAWKLGEGPVCILARSGHLNGILSFGGVHTEDPASTVRSVEDSGLDWDMVTVLTGRDYDDLVAQGVRPGTRVAVHPSRRTLTEIGDLVSGFFLDDRADLVAWLLALEKLQGFDGNVVFAATAAEEVGGEGALYLMRDLRPDVCIALELGPHAPDSPVEIDDQPTVWAHDSYSTMSASDLELLAQLGEELDMDLQFQVLTRGGSDASCAASHGLCARPITLGLPMENSHGHEVIHPGSMENLATLTAALVRKLTA